MHSSIISTLLLSSVASVLATPTPAFNAGACTTLLPTFIQNLSVVEPDKFFDNNAPGSSPGAESVMSILSNFTYLDELSILGGVTASHSILSYVGFQVPAGSANCKLAIIDSAGTFDYETDEPQFTEIPKVNIRSLVPDTLITNPTYNNVLNANPSNVVSNSFAELDPNNWNGELVILGEEGCPTNGALQFVFEVESFGAGGDAVYASHQLEWEERVAGGHDFDSSYTGNNGVILLIGDC